MIIFLYGKDTYRSGQKLKEIIEYYKKIHKSGLNLRFFDFEKMSFEDFKDEFRNQPMFQEKKLLILKNAFSNKDFKEKFLDSKENFKRTENVILFHERGEVSKKDSLFVFLKENARSQEFKPLGGKKLKIWLEKELEKYGTEIRDEAKKVLLDYVGNDLWRLSNEIKKLVLFCEKKIEKEDVEKMVRAKVETDIFKTIDALAKKQKKKALSLVHRHLERGDDPLYLLAMINYQFRNLLMIKEKCKEKFVPMKKLIKELNLHPFVIKKSLQLAKNFSLEELKDIYQKLFETDIKIKTGKLDPEVGLDFLITEI